MADIQVPSIAAATPAAADTVVGVQGGAVKRFSVGALPFTQDGTGAVARTALAKMKESVSVADFGAVGDGVTDDTAAIQAAIDAVSDGCTVRFTPGAQYLTSAALTINKSINVNGEGCTFISSAASSVFLFGEETASHSALSVAITAGVSSFTIPGAVTIAEGDTLSIRADTSHLTDTTLVYRHGVIASVVRVSGGVAYLDVAPLESFTADRIVVYRGVRGLVLENFTIDQRSVASRKFAGIYGTGHQVTVRNCRLYGNTYMQIGIGVIGNNNCIEQNYIEKYTDTTGGGSRQGYGVLVSGNGVAVRNNTVANCKHNIAGGGSYVDSSNISYVSNVSWNEAALQATLAFGVQLDMHPPSCKNWTVAGNTATGGGSMACRNGDARVVGNEFKVTFNGTTAVNATVIEVYGSPLSSLVLEGNEIEVDSALTSGGGGNLTYFYDASTTHGTIGLYNNNITNARLVFSSSVAGCTIGLVDIKGNVFRDGMGACSLTPATLGKFVFQNNTVLNPRNCAVYLGGVGSPIATLTHADISGNYIESNAVNDSGQAIRTEISTITDRIHVRGNTIWSLISDTINTNAVRIVGTNKHVITGNVMNQIVLDSTTTYTYPLFGNTYHGTQAFSWKGSTTVRSPDSALVKSAAPVAGTWAVGDVVYHSVPAASGTIGWVCVTAGTPGTWKAFGAIVP